MAFARTDFTHGDPPAYESVFVKGCDALALTVVFAGHDRDTVERFVAAADLKLDPSSPAAIRKTNDTLGENLHSLIIRSMGTRPSDCNS